MGEAGCELFSKLINDARHVPRVFEIKIKPNVFVGGMGACIGMTKPSGCNGQAKVMYERMAWPRSADHRHKLHRHLIDFFCYLCHKLNEWVIGVSTGGWVAAEVGDLHIAEALRVEVSAKLFSNVIRLLVRDEAEINFSRGARRQDRFRSRALISRRESTNGASRREDFLDAQFHAAGQTFDELFDAVTRLVFICHFGHRRDEFPISL